MIALQILREIGETVRDAWRAPPDDAREIMILAIVMSALFVLVWMAAPSLDIARATFSLALGGVAIVVGWLIHERQSTLGYTIGCVAAGGFVAAVSTLLQLRLDGADAQDVTMVWRTCAAFQQGWMVVAWGVLMVARKRWLARSAARAAFTVACIGFLWSIYVNFGVPDPLQAAAQWGEELARGVGARAVSPWVEPLLGGTLVMWIVWLWHGWWIAHGDDAER